MSATRDVWVASIPVGFAGAAWGGKRISDRIRKRLKTATVQRTAAEIVMGYYDERSQQRVQGMSDRVTYLSDEVAAMKSQAAADTSSLRSGLDGLAARVDEMLQAVGGPHGIAHRAERAVSTALFVAITMNEQAARDGKAAPFELDDLLGSSTAPERIAEIARKLAHPPPKETP